jgi:CRISPR-associated protein Cmr4
MALRGAGIGVSGVAEDAFFREQDSQQPLNLGWLLLPVKTLSDWQKVQKRLKELGVLDEILGSLGVVPDKLFGHVVNSNLEVRTSVAIDPATGAAEEGALFTYEALPRATVLFWEVTAKNPGHFTIGASPVAFNNAGQAVTIEDVHNVVAEAHPYLEHLGIGGMGTRGMGRLRVLAKQSSGQPATLPGQSASQPPTQPEVR